jgi:hypothetical protein
MGQDWFSGKPGETFYCVAAPVMFNSVIPNHHAALSPSDYALGLHRLRMRSGRW